MHSRAVLLLSLFALACLIVAGSVVLHLTTASAATEPPAVKSPLEALQASNLSFFRDSSESAEAASPPVVLSAPERRSADSLETLLRQVYVMFEPEGSGVSNDMIPYLAEMITIINQYEHLVYRIEITEPDAALARRRAQTLNDVLRLNVLEPSHLRIVGRQGLQAAIVEVDAS